MINYRFIRLKDVADEVIYRARQFIVPENFDWGTLVMLINRAMQEVLVRTLPYKDWAYIDTIAVTHGTILPREYIRMLRVLVSETGITPFREARFVDAKEWYATTNWQRQQEWNRATILNPIFTLWGVIAAVPRVAIYIAPNTDYQTGTAPPGTTYYAGNNLSGIMEFYRMPNQLTNDTDVLPIPAEFEELLVLSVLTRYLAKVGNIDRLPDIQKQLIQERLNITKRYAEKRRTEERELDTFVEPVPPVINPPPQSGEVQADLGGGNDR